MIMCLKVIVCSTITHSLQPSCLPLFQDAPNQLERASCCEGMYIKVVGHLAVTKCVPEVRECLCLCISSLRASVMVMWQSCDFPEWTCDSHIIHCFHHCGCFSLSLTSVNALATLLEVFVNIFFCRHTHIHRLDGIALLLLRMCVRVTTSCNLSC